MYFIERKGNWKCNRLYVHFIILSFIFHLRLDLSKCFLLSAFQTEHFCLFLFSKCSILSHLSHRLPVHLPPTLTDQYKPCSYSLCNSTHPPAAPSLFRPNISLSHCSSTILPCLVVWNTNINTQHPTQFCVTESVFFTTTTCCVKSVLFV